MYSRDFVDSKEDKNSDEGLMNLHNNEAGRRVRNNINLYGVNYNYHDPIKISRYILNKASSYYNYVFW